jgi:hypothetical protein
LELGQRYPKARRALIEIRDIKTREFDEGRGFSDLFRDVKAINAYLNAQDATAALFKRIHERDPQLAAQCIHFAREALINDRDYELFLHYVPDAQADFESCKRTREMDLGLSKKMSFMDNPEFRRSADGRFVASVSQLIEALKGVGRLAEAESIRTQATALVNDPKFESAVGDPLAKSASEPGRSLQDLPPVILRTFPVAGTREVEPGDVEIRATFNKDMTAGSWSWAEAWAGSTPSVLDQPRFESDHRTCVMKVKLEPGRTYAWWLNSDDFRNFKDTGGHAAVPYLLIFQTKQN